MMKKFIIGLTALVASTANAGNVIVGVGAGEEKINDTLKVDLYQAQAMYRFDNGIMAGGMVQKGYPELSAVPDETRRELIVGYGTKIDRFLPYVFASYGERDRGVAGDYNYYVLRGGSKYIVNDKVYLNASYRWRDNDVSNINWKTNTYFAGAGYNITPTTSIEFQYGKTNGDFDSDSMALFLINKF